MFPIPEGGDIPGELELFFDGSSPRETVARWRGENKAAGDAYSHSLDMVLSSVTFCTWIRAVTLDHHYFETSETDF